MKMKKKKEKYRKGNCRKRDPMNEKQRKEEEENKKNEKHKIEKKGKVEVRRKKNNDINIKSNFECF